MACNFINLTMKKLTKIVKNIFKSNNEKPTWEYFGDIWDTNKDIGGWDVKSIVDVQKSKWYEFLRLVESNGPLGIVHEKCKLSSDDVRAHNIIMCFAYVLALSAQQKNNISILDWGSGLGHYYIFSKALLPNTQINYVCKDLPLIVESGRDLLPEVEFYDDESYIKNRKFDLVMSSGSLQCSDNWKEVLLTLVSLCDRYLYIARIQVVEEADTYIALQRPYEYSGYKTEFLNWIFNKQELLDTVNLMNMTLIREFLFQEKPKIKGAPEQSYSKGFLFKNNISIVS